MRAVLRGAADLLDRARLGEPVFRVFQHLQALTARPAAADPLLPPPYLRVLTAGITDAEIFLSQGRNAASEFIGLARAQGLDLSPDRRVLEFGCGCGRVARWWIEGSPAQFHGCDINPRLVSWCQTHLAGDFRRTRPKPPLPYADESFDLIYALSVFTHMHDDNARAWLVELARVARPGAVALLTYKDDQLPAAGELQPGLAADGYAIRREGAEGGNLLSNYFTPAGFAARAAPEWRMATSIASGDSANGQAIAVLVRRS